MAKTWYFIRTFLILVAVAAKAAGAPPEEAGATQATLFSQRDLRRRVNALMSPWNRPDSPGLAVLVQQHGQDIVQACTGLADLEQGVAIDAETCFDFASASKHMTAFAVLMLAQEGRLGLDDSIRRRVPELPEFAERIRVRDLLYQTSGLWEFWTILTDYSGFEDRDYITIADVLALLAGQPAPNFEPGSRYAYTNTNYSLLSVIVEQVTGGDFGDWTRDRIFRPLGMRATHFQTDCTRLIPHRAQAYLPQGDGYVLARPSNVEVPGSAHAFTNLHDLSRWLDNFRTHRLGGEELFRQLTEPGTLDDGKRLSYAAGLSVRDYDGISIVEHSGQTGGFKTMLIYCPEQEVGIAVLANERSINAAGIAHEILDICLGRSKPEPSPAAAAPNEGAGPELYHPDPERMDIYAGGYRLEGSGQLLSFHRDGAYLVARFLGLGNEYLQASAPYRFVDFSGQLKVEFQVEGANVITGVALTRGDEVMRARPIAPAVDAASLAKGMSGYYYCSALNCACRLISSNDRLVLRHRRYGDIALMAADKDWFSCAWGFVHFLRDERDAVTGFHLLDEPFAFQEIVFQKVHGPYP